MAGKLKYGPVCRDMERTIVVVDDNPKFQIEAAHFKAHSAHLTGYNSIFNSRESARSFIAGFAGTEYAEAMDDEQVQKWLISFFDMKRRQLFLAPVWDKRSDRATVPVGVFGPHPDYFRLEDLTDEPVESVSFRAEAWQLSDEDNG